MKYDEFIPLFASLEAVFGDQAEAKALLYFDTFKPHNFEGVKAAIATIVQTGDRFPLPKDILAHLPGAASPKNAAKLAWLAACDAATDGPFSEYDPVEGSFPTGEDLDNATFKAIGGVTGLCNLQRIANNPTALSFAERDFCDKYEAVAVADFDAGHALNPGQSPRQLPAASHEPKQIGDIVDRMFSARPRAESVVYYDRATEPGTIPQPAKPYVPEGSQILHPETLQHDDSADPWGGVRNILRQRLHPLVFQLVTSRLVFDGVNESRRRYRIKADPITWQTLTNGGEGRDYKADIERAVAEWTGTTTWTVEWALTV